MAPFVLLADTGGNPRIVYALFNEFVARFAPWMLETSESRVFDVLKRMFKYFGRLLLYHDPELYWLLERHMMTPDLYATSWFVTLFARNFTVESVLALWDLLLLDDNPLGTSFFGVALLVSKRDQLFSIDESRIPETLMMLTANSPEEVRRLWHIGEEMRVKHTPPSFQRLMTDRLLLAPSASTRSVLSAARAMQASVCLQTTPDDLVAGDANYFTWDCRTEAEYKAGHLAQAAHLQLDALREANGKFSQATGDEARTELQAAVEKCEALRRNSHICLVGSGVRDEDNTDVNMLALYLTRIGIPYISTLRGGFNAALEAVRANDGMCSVELVDFDGRRFDVARRMRASLIKSARAGDGDGVMPMSRWGKTSWTERSRPPAAPDPTTGRKSADSGTGISSFLEKTDAEVSRALSRALNGIGIGKASLSSLTSGVSSENIATESPTVPVVNGLSPRDDPTYPLAELRGEDLTSRRRPVSVVSGSPRWPETNAARTNRPVSTSALTEGTTRVTNGQAGRRDMKARGFAGGLFAPAAKTPWGRDAKPGWLDVETLAFPVSAMPKKGFTVNVMDDRVMAGLRLFPCKARADSCTSPTATTTSSTGTPPSSRGGEFRRRYVGVSGHYFMLLSPYANRRHLLEVRLFRYLQDISRITFKRSRPELVTFTMVSADGGVDRVMCLMPDGLKECVDLIKGFIADDGHAKQVTSQNHSHSHSPVSASDSPAAGVGVGEDEFGEFQSTPPVDGRAHVYGRDK